MSDHPVLIFLSLVTAGYFFHLWWLDYQARKKGAALKRLLPGVSPAPIGWILVGIAGALLLVGVETAGEYALGVVEEQSKITAIMLLPLICAGFIEEFIFRGFVFTDGRGPKILWLSIFAASLMFALMHFQYYLEFPDEGWMPEGVKVDAKSGWSLFLLFLNSLWFYYLRFSPRNFERSLIPCFAAHIASNVGVFFVKLAQGYVTGWF